MLEQNVFSQPQMGTAVEKDYVPVKVDADLSPALANAYRVDRVPTDILLSPQGTALARLSCPGTAEAYLAQLAKASQHFKQLAPQQKHPQVQSAYAGLNLNQNVGATPQSNQYAQVQPTSTASAPQQPVVTNNPYINTPNSTAQTQATSIAGPPATAPVHPQSAPPNRYAPAVAPRTAATVPPAAMQSSYNRGPSPATPSSSAALPSLGHPSAVAPSVQMASAQSSLPTPPPISIPKSPQVSAPSTSMVAAGSSAPAPANKSAKVPAGSPPLAFDGCCPVTLKVKHQWVKGDLKFGAYHRGRTFLFAGPEQQQQFLANPDAYSPVFSGLDVVKLLESNERVEGSRKFGFKYLEAFYLFSSEETMKQFAQNPAYYSAGVRQAMLRSDSTSTGTIRR